MKASATKGMIERLLKKGYVFHKNRYYTAAEANVLGLTKKLKKSVVKHLKTGWIDDTRNVANKAKQVDVFVRLVQQELNLEVWPEFHFSTERLYRFDYAIPVSDDGRLLKIAIEVDGGIWARGNSGHSSGKGIKRDMEKSTLASLQGWIMIRRTPDELLKYDTIKLIKTALEHH